jgi:hypothetical protein
MDKLDRWQKFKDTMWAFWFGTNPIVATSVVDKGFSLWSCALQPGENQGRNQRNFGSHYYQNRGKDVAPSRLRDPHATYNVEG